MVIPRDHQGLYACPPFKGGIQTKISGVSSKERKEPFDKEGNVQLRCAQRLVFHDTTLHKEG